MTALLRLLLTAVLAAGVLAPEPDPVGIWQGVLEVMGSRLRIGVNVKRGADGKLAATLDSPDQGASGIPATSVTFVGRTLKVQHDSLGATFEATLDDAGQELKGTFKQGGLDMPITLKRADKPFAYKRPQEPVKPYPYVERQVTYPNPAASGVTIAGTLTMPRGKGPFPAVLLIAGSGPNDRDETVFGHKPFWVLADHLTRRGFAVLRVDKRGVGQTTGDGATATSADYASDAAAGVAFLRKTQGVDPRRIGLVGHSEGGIVGPMVAVGPAPPAFIVNIAGPAVTGEQILIRQGALIAAAMGGTPEQVAASDRERRALIRAALGAPDQKAAAAAVRAELEARFAQMTPEERKNVAGKEKELADGAAAQLASPWMLYFMRHDPAPILARLKCPVLCVFGEKDLQVPPSQSAEPARKALAGNKRAMVRVLPGHNHLLQRCATGSPTEYVTIDETMSPAALKLIGDWLAGAARAGQPGSK